MKTNPLLQNLMYNMNNSNLSFTIRMFECLHLIYKNRLHIDKLILKRSKWGYKRL